MGLVTTVGANKLALKISLGQTLSLATFKVGDGGGSAYTPNVSQTTLNNTRYSGSITAQIVSGNVVTLQCVLPAEVGGWYIREIGIFDSDGVLIGIAAIPERYKPSLSGDSSAVISINVSLTVSNASAITLVADNNIYATTEYADGKIQEHIDDTTDAHGISAITGLQNALNNKQDTIADGGLGIIKLDIDGSTDIGANLADADLIIVDKGASGTNRKSAISRIWTYISGKLVGAISTVTTNDLTASRALVSDASGKISVSSITSTILGYLSNVSSDIQTQINGKAAINANTTGSSGSCTGNAATATTAGNGVMASSNAANGYIKFGNGLIMQWGTTANIPIGATATVTFPIPFPTTNCGVQATYKATGSSSNNGILALQVDTQSLSGCTIHNYDGDTGAAASWFAIGY